MKAHTQYTTQITAYKDRIIDPNVPVLVYRNLHKGAYSIKQYGRVVAHAEVVCLTQTTPKVSEAGRQRVLQERQKNVHAMLRGYLVAEIIGTTSAPVTYNPYTHVTFMCNGKPLECSNVCAHSSGVVRIG